MVATIQGVTEQNKNDICSSIGNALNGTVTHCSFSGGTYSERRRLKFEPAPLYVDIAVPSAEEAENAIASSQFIPSLENLPNEVTVLDISLYGNMIIYNKVSPTTVI